MISRKEKIINAIFKTIEYNILETKNKKRKIK